MFDLEQILDDDHLKPKTIVLCQFSFKKTDALNAGLLGSKPIVLIVLFVS